MYSFLLKKPLRTLAGLAIAAGLFYGQYEVMKNLPGEKDFSCQLGAGLTSGNLLFAALVSLLTGLLFGMMLEVSRMRLRQSYRLGSATALGVMLGTLTTFCTLCTLPVISLFGVGLSLAVFTDYQLYFKIVSLLLLGLAWHLLHRQLQKNCALNACKTSARRPRKR